MVSALIIASVAIVVLLQVASINTTPTEQITTIDEIVNGTFDEIQRLVNNAGRLIKESLETVKSAKQFAVDDDFDEFTLLAEELDRNIVGRVYRILDRTYLLLDQLILGTEKKIEDKVRQRSTLHQVEATLVIMHRIVWDTEDFVSDLVFKAKPEFFKITRRAQGLAGKAHEEFLRNGSNRAEAQQKFDEALQRGYSQAVNLWNESGNNIRKEIEKATKLLRNHSKVLLFAGHEAEKPVSE